MNFNISDVGTTKMTSKGQVVIPEEIREYMKLESGVKFLVMATSEDSIIFKKIHPIPKEDIDELLAKSHAFAKKHGITQNDIEQAIIDVRKDRKKNRNVHTLETKVSAPIKRKVAARTRKAKTNGIRSKRKK